MLAARLAPLPADVAQAVIRYDANDVEVRALWAACVEAYGDPARATEAVLRQPTIISPRYTWPPPLLARSKAALVESLGSEEEALEVMRQNPAVLQCGVSLREQPAAQIRGFAAVRQLADAVPSRAASALLAAFVVGALCAVPPSGGGERDPAVVAVLSVVRPVLGLAGGSVFAATVYFAASVRKVTSDR